MVTTTLPSPSAAPLKFMAQAKGGWAIPIQFFDLNENAVDLTVGGFEPVVLFYQPGRPPLPLAFTTTQGQVGIGVATVPESTARSTILGGTNPGLLGGVLAAIGPSPICRAYAYLLDSLGNATAGQVIEIEPIDWRTADAGDLPPVPTTYVSVGPSGSKGAKGDQGIQGLPGGIVPLTGTAASNIADVQVIRSTSGGLAPASSADSTQVGTIVGIASAAASAAQPVSYQDGGIITRSAWAWSPGVVFFDNNGHLTQTPPTGGFVQPVGRALSATAISVQLGSPIVIVP